MKYIYITLVVIFIIMTLGFIDVGIQFTDGTDFSYRGWNHIFFD